jgi:hypothetical protein
MKMAPLLRDIVLVLALSTILTACPSSGPNGSGGTEPPATSPTAALTVKVKAAHGAPEDFGLVPGDMIAGAEIEVDSSAESGGPSYKATTDESGRAVLMVQSGSYRIIAKKDTHDPYCLWYDGTDVEVVDKPVTIKLYDLWVLCE